MPPRYFDIRANHSCSCHAAAHRHPHGLAPIHVALLCRGGASACPSVASIPQLRAILSRPHANRRARPHFVPPFRTAGLSLAQPNGILPAPFLFGSTGNLPVSF